jgi:hypothetical protein
MIEGLAFIPKNLSIPNEVNLDHPFEGHHSVG